MNGILLVDKPKGWTSFDVVARIRGLVRTELRKTNPGLKNVKVGHTGTLDPAATGLLVLCIGSYTKKVESMIRHDKTYEVELTLGATSNTGDQEGVIVQKKTDHPDDATIISVLSSFVGEQMQTPPAFSAIKIDGKRAYDLARAGKEVKIEPRRVKVNSISEVRYGWPKVSFVASVSSGTYIRSLSSDIGEKLGTGAYMSELRRSRVGNFSIDDSVSVEGLTIDQMKSKIIE